MKIKLILFFCLLFSLNIHAQQWQWANANAGGSNVDRNILITTDSAGFIYITGEFEDTRSFGVYTLTAIGGRDVFVAKYDSAGTCLWAIQGGGTFSDNEGVGISADNAGNVFVAGTFTNQIVFGGYTLNQITNSYNSFIAKFDVSGNCIFLKHISSKTGVFVRGLKGNGTGSFFMTGAFIDSTYFDAISVYNSTPEIFLTKFDSQGNYSWVKTYGGGGEDGGFDVSLDHKGNIYLAGKFKQTATFTTNTVTSYGDFDIFVSKFNPNGDNIWVSKAGATGSDEAFGISTDTSGFCYATGYYYPTPSGMTTLPARFGSILLPDNGAGNMFIAKYDSTGNCVWAKAGGGSQHDEGLSISTDINGNSYVTGLYHSASTTTGPATFGPGFTLLSAGSSDAFVVKYNKFGNVLFAERIGGTSIDKGKSIKGFSNGTCITAGNFATSVTINTVPPTTLTATSPQWRVYLAKYAGGSVGTEEIGSENIKFSVFPNPASNQLNLHFTETRTSNCHIEIFNPLGQMIQQFDNSSTPGKNEFRFDTSFLQPGSYFMRLTRNNLIWNTKFIVTN